MSEDVRAFKDALENLNTRKSSNALIKRVLWFKVHEVATNLRVSLSGTLLREI